MRRKAVFVFLLLLLLMPYIFAQNGDEQTNNGIITVNASVTDPDSNIARVTFYLYLDGQQVDKYTQQVSTQHVVIQHTFEGLEVGKAYVVLVVAEDVDGNKGMSEPLVMTAGATSAKPLVIQSHIICNRGSTQSLEITVYDSSGKEPVSGAYIDLTYPDGTNTSAYSDSDGSAIFPDVDEGYYYVVATKGSYGAAQDIVVCSCDPSRPCPPPRESSGNSACLSGNVGGVLSDGLAVGGDLICPKCTTLHKTKWGSFYCSSQTNGTIVGNSICEISLDKSCDAHYAGPDFYTPEYMGFDVSNSYFTQQLCQILPDHNKNCFSNYNGEADYCVDFLKGSYEGKGACKVYPAELQQSDPNWLKGVACAYIGEMSASFRDPYSKLTYISSDVCKPEKASGVHIGFSPYYYGRSTETCNLTVEYFALPKLKEGSKLNLSFFTVDENNKHLANAQAWLTTADGQVYTNTSNESGNVLIADIPAPNPGDYEQATLHLAKAGYHASDTALIIGVNANGYPYVTEVSNPSVNESDNCVPSGPGVSASGSGGTSGGGGNGSNGNNGGGGPSIWGDKGCEPFGIINYDVVGREVKIHRFFTHYKYPIDISVHVLNVSNESQGIPNTKITVKLVLNHREDSCFYRDVTAEIYTDNAGKGSTTLYRPHSLFGRLYSCYPATLYLIFERQGYEGNVTFVIPDIEERNYFSTSKGIEVDLCGKGSGFSAPGQGSSGSGNSSSGQSILQNNCDALQLSFGDLPSKITATSYNFTLKATYTGSKKPYLSLAVVPNPTGEESAFVCAHEQVDNITCKAKEVHSGIYTVLGKGVLNSDCKTGIEKKVAIANPNDPRFNVSMSYCADGQTVLHVHVENESQPVAEVSAELKLLQEDGTNYTADDKTNARGNVDFAVSGGKGNLSLYKFGFQPLIEPLSLPNSCQLNVNYSLICPDNDILTLIDDISGFFKGTGGMLSVKRAGSHPFKVEIPAFSGKGTARFHIDKTSTYDIELYSYFGGDVPIKIFSDDHLFLTCQDQFFKCLTEHIKDCTDEYKCDVLQGCIEAKNETCAVKYFQDVCGKSTSDYCNGLRTCMQYAVLSEQGVENPSTSSSKEQAGGTNWALLLFLLLLAIVFISFGRKLYKEYWG